MFNRRRQVIIFVTLVLTGAQLLAGATLGEGLGTLILGVAFAWLIGSEATFRSYDRIRGYRHKFWIWSRAPFLIAIGGCVLSIVAIWSNFNSFLACAAMATFGVFIAPLMQWPTRRLWLKCLLSVVWIASFFFSAAGISMLSDTGMSNAQRIGELCVSGLIALSIGCLWLAKGWKLILAGINTQPIQTAVEENKTPPRKRAVLPYILLFVSVLALTFWLGLLAFSGFSDSVLRFQTNASNSSNTIPQVVVLMLLGRWPYSSWRTILAREPNTSLANVKRHKIITFVLGALFAIVLSLAATFGIQNGHDRMSMAEVEEGTKDFQDLAKQIGAIKARDLRTTKDYVDAYEEIEPLMGEFDMKLQTFTDIILRAQETDKERGPLNIQRIFSRGKEEQWVSWDLRMFDLANQDNEVTKKQIAVVKQMADLPEQDQAAFWTENFQPLQKEEAVLRQKIVAVMADEPDKKK